MPRRGRRERRIECFEIDAQQFDTANLRDPETVPDLEQTLAGLGAIPAGARKRGQAVVYCVEVTNPDLELDEVVQAFANAGLMAWPQSRGAHHERKEVDP